MGLLACLCVSVGTRTYAAERHALMIGLTYSWSEFLDYESVPEDVRSDTGSVTVISAARAYERALGTSASGLFATAIQDALAQVEDHVGAPVLAEAVRASVTSRSGAWQRPMCRQFGERPFVFRRNP